MAENVWPDGGLRTGAPATPAATAEVRRRPTRHDCRLDAEFSVKSSGATGRATIVNLGLGGARVDLPVEVGLPDELTLKFSLPGPQKGGGAAAALEVTGRVVWTVADQPTGPFPTGLQFPALDDAARRRIYDFIGSTGG